jgi:serine/threonine protein kinase
VRNEAHICRHIKEQQESADLGAENVVHIIDDFEYDYIGTSGLACPLECIALEQLDMTVTELLEQRDVTLDETKDLFGQFLQGLAFVHASGIVHGDIHSGNVMLQYSYESFSPRGLTRTLNFSLKICDFGEGVYICPASENHC